MGCFIALGYVGKVDVYGCLVIPNVALMHYCNNTFLMCCATFMHSNLTHSILVDITSRPLVKSTMLL